MNATETPAYSSGGAPFRFVLVGTGVISNAYVQALDKLPGVELVAIVSRSGKRPESVSDQVKIPVVRRLSELEIPYDAVILATPNGCHREVALDAAERGKHVLSEKVLEISLESCDEMIAACAKHQVKLGVGYQRRTSPVNRRLKKLLEQGALGEVFAVDLEAKFYRGEDYYQNSTYRGSKAVDGGGPFFQQASHDLDLLVWFFGMPERVASSLGTFLHKIESEDHGAAVMRFASGQIGTIIASTCCQPNQAAKISIYSDRGTMVLSGDQILQLEMEGLDRARVEAVAIEDLRPGQEGIIQDFVQAVQDHRPPLICGTQARASVELILKIYQSQI